MPTTVGTSLTTQQIQCNTPLLNYDSYFTYVASYIVISLRVILRFASETLRHSFTILQLMYIEPSQDCVHFALATIIPACNSLLQACKVVTTIGCKVATT